MRRSDFVLAAAWGMFCILGVALADAGKPAATPNLATTSTPVTTPTPAVAHVPNCGDLNLSIDGIPSVGSVKVPTTLDSDNSFKDMDLLKSLNRMFAVDKVEKLVFDAKVDMPSQARLLVEYRCFGSWKRQHEFYRRVLREHTCAYIRHRAAQMLEFDMCNTETVNVLINEYTHSLYSQTRELIIRKLGMAQNDKRASSLVDETIKSKSKALAQAASEGKLYGQSQSCVPQDGAGKPYYGMTDIADVCEHTENTAGLLGNEAPAALTAPASDSSPTNGSGAPIPGGASGVDFNH